MNNLKALRELIGLKQAALAHELNVKNQASISEWETGRKALSLDNAIMLANFFRVSVGCIAGTEPIPDGYPVGFNVPTYNKPDPNTTNARKIVFADIPNAPVYVYNKKERPFSEEQTKYLDEQFKAFNDGLDARFEALEERLLEHIREDTSSSSEQESEKVH